MTVDLSQVSGPSEDGRHLRRRRNRDAAIDALISLVEDGNLNPTVADVAARAGVSARSLFRYFADVDDLSREAVDRMTTRVAPSVMALRLDPTLPLEERIVTLIERLDHLYAEVRPLALAARVKAPSIPPVAEQLSRGRTVLRAMLENTFSPELNACAPGERANLLAQVEMWCTFEVQHLLRSQSPVEGTDPAKVTLRALSLALGAST